MPNSPQSKASRPRRPLTAVAATAMALTLAVCGSSSSTFTSSGGTAATRTVATAHGTVSVPAHPDATVRFVNRTAQLAALKRKYEDRIAAVRKIHGSQLADGH
ncbi:hypothetical protein OG588_02695 [Streptomyces prunicolor]|uniref:hypothetical protein n=1 Tax=Streptomyces prunicolor TaxID=67348 RepID=UPI003867B50A|nr:hypothetical protein OG588_02695 [Streptomyces prunicolor]